MGWDPSRLALALAPALLALALGPKKKILGNFFLTGTGLADPVRDGKFPGNGLMGTGQTPKSGFLEAPGPGILDLTLYQ